MSSSRESDKEASIPNYYGGMDQAISHLLSLLRLIATLGIFTYHFTTLFGKTVDGVFLISIYIFCFLTGYLSYSIYRRPLNWLLRRFYSIMIPYWFIIIPALLINRMISYKETSLAKDIVSLLGGSLFIDDRVYMISWYITFVLLLYLFVFMRSQAKKTIQSFLIWLLAILFFGLILEVIDFFMVFAFGLILAKIKTPPDKSVSQKNFSARILFFLQDKCYAFFLIHAGILLLLFKTNLIHDGLGIFIIGFLISGLGAVLLRNLTEPLVAIMITKTEKLMCI